jgi:hypothetical protein
MNERIQTLAEQAGFYVADGKIYIPSTSEEITTCQKNFAELIVQECLYIVEGEDDGSADTKSVRLAMIRMKKHFGVDQ